VPMQPLAGGPLVRNEVPGAKDQVILGDANGVALSHLSPQSPVPSLQSPTTTGDCGLGTADCQRGVSAVIVSCRRATNRQAETRSAAGPRLEALPFARSQASRPSLPVRPAAVPTHPS